MNRRLMWSFLMQHPQESNGVHRSSFESEDEVKIFMMVAATKLSPRDLHQPNCKQVGKLGAVGVICLLHITPSLKTYAAQDVWGRRKGGKATTPTQQNGGL